jgi:hypothetical protein
MLMMHMIVSVFLEDEENVNKFQNAESIEEQKRDEPTLLISLGRMPKAVALENNDRQD